MSENTYRLKWKSKYDFTISCIGFAVGLGNIWRFPYLCYKNGGGAFLVPYLISLIFGGLPMFLLESAVGQYNSKGGISAWGRMCPLFKGVGYAGAMIAFWSNSYYIVVLAWSNFYLWNSLTFKRLPWETCDNSWNTANCSLSIYNLNVSGQNYLSKSRDSPSLEFWRNRVLAMTDSLENQGSMRWELFICLAITWIICYFCIWKGINLTGKIIYFTSTLPYLLITILLVRGLTLDGALDGIKYLFIPDWSLLKSSEVWIDAVTQIFFSYGLGVGAIVALGSYNNYNNNLIRDAFTLVLFNEGTCLLSGLTIFSVLGFMAKSSGKNISEVADSGAGLIFVAYPAAMSELPFSKFFNIIFFIMILFIGLDTQFCTVEGFITAVCDEWPGFFNRKKYFKQIFVATLCIIHLLIGSLCLTQGGIYVFNIFNTYAVSGWSFLILLFFECIAISWCYGLDRFCKNIEDMIGFEFGSAYWKLCWMLVTPLLCISVALFSVYKYEPFVYEHYVYPWWGELLGYLLTFSSTGFIPVYAIYKLVTNKDSFKHIISGNRESDECSCESERLK